MSDYDAIAVRLDAALLEAVEEERERLRRENPALVVNRSEAIRSLLYAAIAARSGVRVQRAEAR